MGGLIVVVLWPMILPIAVLLLIRRVWKKSGTMDRSYIDRHSGWKWWLLILLRYGLLVFILWEILLVLFCGAYTIDSPHN